MATGQSQVGQDDGVEKAKQQIRGLVGEIAEISKGDMLPEQYYAAFLQRVIQALAAVGGAIWTLGEGNAPQLAYQINLSPKLLDKESEDSQKHYRLLDYITSSNQSQLIPPMSSAGDERMGGNPTKQLLVVAPLGHDGQVEGLVEIFQRADTEADTQRGYLRFLLQMCELSTEWFKNRKLRQFTDRHSLWSQADQFSRGVHESLDVRETSYTIVNEGRRLLGCDRVSIAVMKAGKCVIEAVSGQDTLDNRSNVVTMLGKLATRVVATGEQLWYLGSTEDFPPQIEEAVEEYVDHSYTKSLAVIPLRNPKTDLHATPSPTTGENSPKGEIIGALIVEQIESEIPREVLNPRLELVLEHTSRALSNSLEHNSLFLMPLWRALGKSRWVVNARNLPRTITIGVSVATLLLLSIVIPWDFDMRAKGALQPVDKQDIYAPEDTRVVEVLADNNKPVHVGEPLVRLESDQLKQQLNEASGELNAANELLSALRKQISDRSGTITPTERERAQAEFGKVMTQVESLNERLKILRQREDNLTVKSPMNGRVITWDVRKNLINRPVGVGQVLMTVAAENTDYEVELFMPERRIKHMTNYRSEIKKKDPAKDLQVDFILMTAPGTFQRGTVIDVSGAAEAHEEHGNMVRVRVKPLTKVPNARPGASVSADVHCGKAPLIYSKLHEAWEWLEANVFFSL